MNVSNVRMLLTRMRGHVGHDEEMEISHLVCVIGIVPESRGRRLAHQRWYL